MVRLTLKGMRARKWRLFTSMLSVMFGVAFVAASLTLGDTIKGSFDGPVADAHAGVDVFVQPADDSGLSTHGVDASALAVVEDVDGVGAVAGSLSGFAQLRSPETGQTPVLSSGLSMMWVDDADLSPLTVARGRAPSGEGEVVVDVGTADSLGVGIGDRARLVSFGPATEVEVVGIAQLGEGGMTVLGIDPVTARVAFGMDDRYSELLVRGEAGIAQQELVERVEAALVEAGQAGQVRVRTESEVTRESLDSIAEETGMITTFLTVFAAITLFVGGFLIVNTFSTLVAQRTREMAVLRSLGASRSQIVGGVVLEAGVVGLLASLVGLGVGVLVATGLQEVLRQVGLNLPDSGIEVSVVTIVVTLVLGPVVTVIAALLPARRAAKVRPLEAMREASVPSVVGRGRMVLAAALAVVGAVALAVGANAGAAGTVGLGAAAVVLAAVAAGPVLVRGWARLVRRPLGAVGGGTARLAVGNLGRSPKRAAATASALVVGLALVQGTSVVGESMGGMAQTAIEDTVLADTVVWSSGGMPYGAGVAQEIAGRDDVAGVVPVSMGQVEVDEDGVDVGETTVYAVPSAELSRVLDVAMVEGSLTDLRHGSVLVVEDSGLALGDVVEMTVAGAGSLDLVVVGTYEGTPALGDHLVTTSTLERLVPSPYLIASYVTAADGVDAEALSAAIDSWLVEAHPLVSAMTTAEFVEVNRSLMDQMVMVVTVLLGMSLAIALLGVSTTLTLSALERTRELGMLRALGMSRVQTRWTIRWESILIAVYGVLLGTGLGLGIGAAVSGVLMTTVDVPVAVPVERVVVVAFVAIVAAVLAAGLPARRASRMDVLAAVNSQ